MLRYPNKIHKAFILLIAFVLLMASCKKADVDFGKESLTDDPNTIVIDTMTIPMSTFQLDSFGTSADNLFKVGVHYDTIFGKYESKAYMQLGLPAVNPVNACNGCTFDSVAFVTRYTGATYGDTTEDFTLNIHRINQQVYPYLTPIGYNIDTFSYDTASLATMVLSNTQAWKQSQLSIRMNDAFGMQLFDMFKRNSDTITDLTLFNKFFNGLVITGKGTHNNSMYYFSTTATTTEVVMKMYYTTHGTTPVASSIDFPINPTSYQFNGYTYDKSNTYLSAFVPKKRQVISTSQTGDKAYLHGNSGLYPYFSFPYLFSIKELHPYIKVIKAELQIEPSLANYGPNTYYTLPPALEIHTISADNFISSGGLATPVTGSTTVQTGNLVIDNQFHLNTRYTYDLTSFVNTILKNGIFAQQNLVLVPSLGSMENRLILENGINNKSVKLKLYVIGL